MKLLSPMCFTISLMMLQTDNNVVSFPFHYQNLTNELNHNIHIKYNFLLIQQLNDITSLNHQLPIMHIPKWSINTQTRTKSKNEFNVFNSALF